MIHQLKVVRAKAFYPYRNQAIEKYLLDSCAEGEMTLYLWANDKTVFIGKNQNAYTECRISELRADGGYLARRFTGGGAVYHDKGNLNFTFIVPREDYNISNQFGIMAAALRSFGLHAEVSGRNDVLIDGKKFSGNAFYKSERAGLHHGTILISSDRASIEKYLSVSPVKLLAKGVKSVSGRVCNLAEYAPALDREKMASALVAALRERYPAAAFGEIPEESLPEEELKRLTAQFADETYLLGEDVTYDVAFQARYEWGVADIRLSLEGERILKAKIYSDALDTACVSEKEKRLAGLDLGKEIDPEVRDIIETFRGISK